MRYSQLGRNGQLGTDDPWSSGKGDDLLVTLVGCDKIPVAIVMKEKLTARKLQEEYGTDDPIYLWNKNLQRVPRRVRGGIIWLPALQVVACVMDHRHGVKACVMVLHPRSRKDKKLVVDMRQEGCFLDVVAGPPPLALDQKFKSREVDSVSGHVLSRVDDDGCIKMDINGPDILMVDESVPEDMKKILQKETPLISWRSKEESKKRKLEDNGRYKVPVVYVCCVGEGEEDISSRYKYIQTHFVEKKGETQWDPVVLVPTGEPYADPKMKCNNR